MKFLLAVLGALIGGAAIVALGVLVIYLMRSPDPGPFDAATTVVIVLYLVFPLFVVAAGMSLFAAVVLLVGAAVSAAIRTKRTRDR